MSDTSQLTNPLSNTYHHYLTSILPLAPIQTPTSTPTSDKCTGKSAALVMQSCTREGPWGQSPLIKSQMDQAFGSHTCIEISGSSPTEADLLSYNIIVVEGSAYFWTKTRNWLNNGGKTTLENLAMAGASVFVNAAPQQYYDGNFPFGATLANYYSPPYGSGSTARDVEVVNTDLLPPSNITSYSANSYAHGKIHNYSPLFEPWIMAVDSGVTQEPVLVGGRPLSASTGFVALGAMTTSNYHSPSPDANILRVNILKHLCQEP